MVLEFTMEFIGATVALVALAAVAWKGRLVAASRQEERLGEADAFRLTRRAADEDVTTFGEELSALHEETLATLLDQGMRADYQRALDAYEDAKTVLRDATAGKDVTAVTKTLENGRYAQACVLARRDGRPAPERRSPCFFDPAHGPASRDVTWAPSGGVEREIAVCFRDAQRLEAGDEPDVRLVRLGNRRVPWFSSGPAYAAWAAGWYADLIDDGRIHADRLTMTYSAGLARHDGIVIAGAVAWSDPGAWDGGGILGGHDYGHSGFDGGSGGGFDGGGFDGGGGGGGDGGGS